MSIGNTIYITVLFIATIIAVFVSITAWKRRHSEHAIPFIVLIISLSFWTLFQALMFLVNNYSMKIIFANSRYFSIQFVSIAFFAMAYEYRNKKKVLSYKKWLIFSIFPSLCLLILWTNPLHHFFYTEVAILKKQLDLTPGPVFWIYYAYIQLFVIYSIILYIKSYLNSVSIYRKQAGMIVLAAVIPNTSNLLYNFELLPIRGNDVTPIAFLISSVLMFYVLFYYKLYDILPIARDNVIESMDDLVIVLDNQKRIIDLNIKAMELTKTLGSNRKISSYLGIDIVEIFSNWKEFINIFKSELDNLGKNERITYDYDGSIKYYHINRKYIYDKNGIKNGELLVLRDVTALEEALNEAREAKDIAENASRSKGYFLANMSHEIRTPMNAIIGLTDILYTNELDLETQKEYLRMITGSAQSLLLIINDILDISKIDAGKMEIENVNMNIRQLVKETVEYFIFSHTKPDLVITFDIEKSVPDSLMGDPLRLRQLLTNLISNAIKFTDSGSVTISIHEINRENNRVNLEIVIVDTGIGIPRDKIEKLFESFNQLDGSTTRKYGGTGLGLSIVKSFLDLMKGTIVVESELGIGSRFICTIPFIISDITTNSLDEDNSIQKKYNPKDISDINILVTEDNLINQKIMKVYLEKTQCSFDFANNGSIALQMLDEKKYDLVLMDVQMPVMDGLEATRRIREKEKLSGEHIQIIALTAGAMVFDVDKCLEAGMDKHISKPVKASKLFEILNEIMLSK